MQMKSQNLPRPMLRVRRSSGAFAFALSGLFGLFAFSVARSNLISAETADGMREANSTPSSEVTEVDAEVTTSEASPPADPEAIKFFESKVRPLLIEKCQKCHGAEKQSGGLRLDGRAALLRGGESGAAIVPHQPTDSVLIDAINFESFEMPPDGKMSDKQIAILTKWVADGAVWPGTDITVNVRAVGRAITDEDRDYWCFQPLTRVEPTVDAGDQWSRNAIDRFVLARLKQHELSPQSEANRLTLLRRVTESLTGLPPTLNEIDNFLADESPDAYDQVVQRLLDSPAHGEHMAQLWLDIVRYGESDGYRQDAYRPTAWRYRDYVIRSFNADKPYDQFVMEQLAGDEMNPENPDALAGTGYLRLGIYEYNLRDPETQWKTMLEDITDTTGDVFLGLGMGCAKCHDHKFDPILQADYYRLQSFFSNVAFRDDVPLATPAEIEAYREKLANWEAATKAIREEMDSIIQPRLASSAKGAIKMFPPEVREIMDKSHDERTAYERQIAHLVHLQVLDAQEKVEGGLKDKVKERWDELKLALKEFDSIKPAPLPEGRTATDISSQPSPVFIPGKSRLGEITPGFLAVLDQTTTTITPPPNAPESSGRRTALARWITDPANPLTARVIVNRVWQQHFGTGLVSSPSDFGKLGEPPSHPELLDWLATEFINQGWSLKWLHREIVRSSTFQQKSESESFDSPERATLLEQARKIDPANRYLWKFPTRRLTGEQIRDAALAVGGELKTKSGGAGVSSSSTERSIYLKIMRNSRDELLSTFDFPDRLTSAGTRSVTTTPTQALLLINGEWGLQRANAFAKRVEATGPTDESRVQSAYRIAFGREPSSEETLRAVTFLQQEPGQTPSKPPVPFPFAQMPERPGAERPGRALSLNGASTTPLPALSTAPVWDGNQMTIEAIVLLRSLYPDASVRTIVSQWDSDTTHPGWSLGVTSTKSAYKPRNLILQLIGTTKEEKHLYEVVPSGLHLELNRPYRVQVSVQLDQTSPEGITFQIQDLSDPKAVPQRSQAVHQVVRGLQSDQPVLIGGRSSSTRHRWDGLIDELSFTGVTTPPAGSTGAGIQTTEFGRWNFENAESPLADLSPVGNHLRQGELVRGDRRQALIDFCHILINSNEFLYLD
ncbi:MAG: PSD1 and planctomycete cytochrome C domain-containing protein [Planctomycetaceae bacterium]